MDTFKQAYILTMETGAVFLAVVEGETFEHGLQLAHAAVHEVTDAEVYDDCQAPVKAKEALPLGVRFVGHIYA